MYVGLSTSSNAELVAVSPPLDTTYENLTSKKFKEITLADGIKIVNQLKFCTL